MLPRILLSALISLLGWGVHAQTLAASPAHPRLKIALDAGHGGDDTGAKGRRGLLEKEAALAIARQLGKSLEEAGFEVIFTRREDTFIPLWDRAKLANEAGAHLFLSIHLNAARARAAKGSEVYFLSLDRGDEDAASVAALENAGAGSAPGTDNVVAGILQDMAQEAYLQDSERLAVAIQLQLNRLGGIKERGVKQAPFIVLRGAAMPAVLVESAFISNPKEEAKLKDKAFLKKLSVAITQGVRGYFAGGAGTVRRKAIGTSSYRAQGALLLIAFAELEPLCRPKGTDEMSDAPSRIEDPTAPAADSKADASLSQTAAPGCVEAPLEAMMESPLHP